MKEIKLEIELGKVETSEDISNLADHLLAKMKQIETEHPYVSTPPYSQSWNLLKIAIQSEHDDPSADSSNLESLYSGTRELLNQIAKDRNQISTIGKTKPLNPETYLKASFQAFTLFFQAAINSESYHMAVNTMAETLLMGNPWITLDFIAPEYQQAVVRKIFTLLIYDDFERQQIDETIREFGEDNMLKMIKESDEILQAIIDHKENIVESVVSRAARIVLAARDQVDYENGTPSNRLKDGEDLTGLAEIRRAMIRIIKS